MVGKGSELIVFLNFKNVNCKIGIVKLIEGLLKER